jgi:hypothetical protein
MSLFKILKNMLPSLCQHPPHGHYFFKIYFLRNYVLFILVVLLFGKIESMLSMTLGFFLLLL